MTSYPWKRFWCPRGEEILLTEKGYLVDPDLKGPSHNLHLVPFEMIAEDSCLIFLGEPGIGKSTALVTHVQEIQQRCNSSLRCLDVDLRAYRSEQRLQQALFHHPEVLSWQDDTSTLHLFLDSLDESLLRLDSITDMLLEELEQWPRQRLYLRIACRTADWRATFEERLRLLWGQDAIGVFEMAPLRYTDVRVAAEREVNDVEAFFREVNRVAAVPFAIKPVTLTLLLNMYRHSGILPTTQREVYERGCELLCEETNLRRRENGLTGNFTPPQRLRAAERLAAVTIFGNRYAIWTGVDQGNVPEADIPLRLCASEGVYEEHFTEPALKEALATGLFSARGVQELGWAHQTYAEFLAACFVTRAMSGEQILSLIRHPDDSRGRLIPQLYATAAWIACMDPLIFRSILHVEPEVLLSSDVAAIDLQDRSDLVLALLQYYKVEGALDDSRRNATRYQKLAHPGLAAQLESYVCDKMSGHIPRRVAIEIAEACQESNLGDALLHVALDNTDIYIIRISAAVALKKIGSPSVIAQLKPLLRDGNDPDDELKGIALQALWPGHLTAKELFAALTVPQNSHLIGLYERFLSIASFVDHLHATDLFVALAWTQQQIPSQHPAFSHLVNRILQHAWQHLEAPEIAPLFAQVVGQRLEQHNALFGESLFSLKPLARQEDISTFIQHLREDIEKRRLLLGLLLPRWQEPSPVLFALVRSSVPLIYEEDLPWLLELLRQETNESAQRKLVQVILLRFNRWLLAHVEAIREASQTQPLLAQAFAWLLESEDIPLQQTQELERGYDAQREQRMPLISSHPLDPPPSEMVQTLLDRYESEGDLNAWWQLNRALTVEPTSSYYGNEFAADLTMLPGWLEADEKTRKRLIRAAHTYVLARAPQAQRELDEHIHTWMGTSLTIVFPLYAGYRAFLLLQQRASELLATIPSIVWQQWAPMLASYPLQQDDPEMEPHRRLICTAYQYASTEIIATCLAHVDQQNRELHALNCLHLVEACWDNQLEASLLAKVGDGTLDSICISHILTVVLTHNPAAASTIAETLLQQAYTRGNYDHAAVLAGALLTHTSASSWKYVWPLLEQNDAFGQALLLGLQRGQAFENTFVPNLAASQVANLFLRAVDLFPPADDPPGPNGFVSGRQLLSIWRNQLITSLQHRGSHEGCAALRTIVLAHPEMEWIRWVLVDAERLMLRRTWSGFKPQEILAMAQDKARRLVKNSEHLLAVIEESLIHLGETLHGETPARIFLWDVLPAQNKQRKSSRPKPAQGESEKRYRPKDENSLSNYIKLHLERDLKQRGIIVLREVEIRYAAGGDPGERIDLYVDAFVPGPHQTRVDVLTVIIEVKGCWHRDVETAMQTQLVERYLKDNPDRQGLYLVGWFNCSQWDSDDYRKKDAPQIGIEEARTQFAQQAKALTILSEGRYLVKSFVLDTALR